MQYNCKVKKNEELLKNKDDIKLKENNQVNIDELDIDDKTKIILSLLLNQNKKLMKELKEEMDQIKNKYDKLEEENKEIKEENKEITKKISKINKKTINNNINTQNNQLNTINNNVILAHGKEDLSKIDLETIMKCMSTIKHKEIIPSITKHVYLNDEKPENKNFCVVDMARNKCKYYNGKKWLVGKTTDKIDKIFDSIHNVLTDPFEKERINKTIEFIKANPKKFNEKWIKISNTYLKSLYDEDDKENMENKLKVLEELKLIFFNNKDEITKIKLES
jgi:cell division protein ZapA